MQSEGRHRAKGGGGTKMGKDGKGREGDGR